MMSKIERYNAIDKAYSCRHCMNIRRREDNRIDVKCDRVIDGAWHIVEVRKTPTHTTDVESCLTCEFYIEDEREGEGEE